MQIDWLNASGDESDRTAMPAMNQPKLPGIFRSKTG
jgi:hypothetical protein